MTTIISKQNKMGLGGAWLLSEQRTASGEATEEDDPTPGSTREPPHWRCLARGRRT